MPDQSAELLDRIAAWDRERRGSRSDRRPRRERSALIEAFPLEGWPTLELDRYALGTQVEHSFCWHLEFGARELGSIRGGNAMKHIIFRRRQRRVVLPAGLRLGGRCLVGVPRPDDAGLRARGVGRLRRHRRPADAAERVAAPSRRRSRSTSPTACCPCSPAVIASTTPASSAATRTWVSTPGEACRRLFGARPSTGIRNSTTGRRSRSCTSCSATSVRSIRRRSSRSRRVVTRISGTTAARTATSASAGTRSATSTSTRPARRSTRRSPSTTPSSTRATRRRSPRRHPRSGRSTTSSPATSSSPIAGRRASSASARSPRTATPSGRSSTSSVRPSRSTGTTRHERDDRSHQAMGLQDRGQGQQGRLPAHPRRALDRPTRTTRSR